MKSAIHAKRKTDAIISIRQDNNARQIFITNMNHAAERLTGHSAAELTGKSFSGILAPRINELLAGYLEFGNSGSDFGAVARRIPNFQILTSRGDIVPVSLKVFNLVAQAGGVQEYELLLRDIKLIEKIAELKDLILHSDNEITAKDFDTGLPSINSVVYALDTSYNFLAEYSAIEVCFALVEIGNIGYYAENYNEHVAFEIIGTLGTIVKKCCRNEDVVGYMGDGVVGVVLLDCNTSDAKAVINRIRDKVDKAKITMQNGRQVTLSLAIAYTQMRKDVVMETMIDACEGGLNHIAERGGEGVVQV